jgi:chemotaxis protein MotB
MTKQAWIIATTLSIAVVIGFIGLSVWEQAQRLEQAQAELAQIRSLAEERQTQLERLKGTIEENTQQIQQLQREKAEVAHAQQTLEHKMRTALESKDVTISELQGKLTVNILDRILFDSGEAVLKLEGEQILDKIARILDQYPKRQIHVIGHTDNIPIRASARSRFASNWELSTARAIAAVRFLQDKSAVDPQRLGAVGYGEFHPVADNSTAEGRAKNRRIALVVMPEEFARVDVPSRSPQKSDSSIGKPGEAPTKDASAVPVTPNVQETKEAPTDSPAPNSSSSSSP